MTAISIPPPTQRLSDKEFITDPWYRVMLEIQRLRTDLDAQTRLTRGLGAYDTSGGAVATFVGTAVMGFGKLSATGTATATLVGST